MFDLSALWLIIGVNLALFALCLVAALIINEKLKEGKDKLQQGWQKYRANNKWFVRLFFSDELKQGYNDLRTGEKLYAKFMAVKRGLVIVIILTAAIDLGLLGFMFLA